MSRLRSGKENDLTTFQILKKLDRWRETDSEPLDLRYALAFTDESETPSTLYIANDGLREDRSGERNGFVSSQAFRLIIGRYKLTPVKLRWALQAAGWESVLEV